LQSDVVLPLRSPLPVLGLVHQGRYLALPLHKCTHGVNTILLPLDDLRIVGGNVCLDVMACKAAHLDYLGVEDDVEW
jgi:hypothetical protein